MLYVAFPHISCVNMTSFIGEVKTLMIQLLRGVRHLHDNWILHRDLKTSNLLLSHKGILKVGYDGFFYLQEISEMWGVDAHQIS